jgi:hypothetical protein
MGGFLVFPIPVVTFNFQNPSLLNDPLHMQFGLILIFLEDPAGDCAGIHGASLLDVCLFRQCSFCHIHKEYRLCRMLRISFLPGL